MAYISVAQAAKKWKLSQRSVRNYCTLGRIPGAFLTGKTWNIPQDATKPTRKPKPSKVANTVLHILKAEQAAKQHGGFYHKIQIDLTYNSNHIEGSQLSHEQTRYIFETNTIGVEDNAVKVDDIVETANHFKCIDMVIENANYKPSERFIKELHGVLKNGTSDSRKAWFAVGDYKRQANEVGGHHTTSPEHVAAKMKELITKYNHKDKHTFEELLDFHYQFEAIHPFQDGNGRIGRLILFKECLRNNIVPFIITDNIKMFYYKGLNEWPHNHERLIDTCLSAQDQMKAVLDYFKIKY